MGLPIHSMSFLNRLFKSFIRLGVFEGVYGIMLKDMNSLSFPRFVSPFLFSKGNCTSSAALQWLAVSGTPHGPDPPASLSQAQH